jgi:FMN-dependent NADH-azoreductase
VSGSWVAAAYTPEDARTPQQKEVLAVSELLIAELQNADEYVISVPIHNFSIPSTLKLWIDQIVRIGKTVGYSANGREGLLKGKKATLLMASGGVYDQNSATESLNFVTPYLRTIFGFIGITGVHFIAAGGTQKLTGEVDPRTFLAPSLERVHVHASS